MTTFQYVMYGLMIMFTALCGISTAINGSDEDEPFGVVIGIAMLIFVGVALLAL